MSKDKGKPKFIRKNGKVIPIGVDKKKGGDNRTKPKGKVKIALIGKKGTNKKLRQAQKSGQKKGAGVGFVAGAAAALGAMSSGTKGMIKSGKGRAKYISKLGKTSRGRAGLLVAGLSGLGGAMLGSGVGGQRGRRKKFREEYKKGNIKAVAYRSKQNTGF